MTKKIKTLTEQQIRHAVAKALTTVNNQIITKRKPSERLALNKITLCYISNLLCELGFMED